MIWIVLAFAGGALLGSLGTAGVLAGWMRKRDLKWVSEEIARTDSDLRKMDRNFRLFLEDCKAASGKAADSAAASARTLSLMAEDMHAKLAACPEAAAEAVREGMAAMDGRFDVVDGALRRIGEDVSWSALKGGASMD